MAEQGYVTLMFDASCGGSEANPTSPKSPLCEWKMFIAQWITLSASLFVNQERIRYWVYCAGGGYAVNSI